MARSSPSDSINWMELSRPTVKGKTAWGKRTVSRTGRTAILRTPGFLFSDGLLEGGILGGWFGIERPFINFPSLDSADFEKFQQKSPRNGRPATRHRISPGLYGLSVNDVP